MPKAGKTKVAAKSHKLIHPQSRKANKLGAREMHKQRVSKVHKETNLRRSVLMEKLTWFKEALDSDKPNYSKDEIDSLVERYLERFEEELEQISIVNSIKSRTGRQHATREDIINTTKQREEEQFTTCGIEIPDILDGRNLKVFKAWDGHQKYIANIKMRRVVRTVAKDSHSQEQSNSRGSDPNQRRDLEDLDEEDNEFDDEGDDDEGVEEDILDSDAEDGDLDVHESMNDEGVDSH